MSYGLGPVVDIVYLSVGNRPQFVVKRFLAPDVHKRILEAFVREPLCTLRVHHSDAVHFEAVWIHVRCDGSYGDAPYAVLSLDHVGLRGELRVELHALCVRGQIIERYGVVLVYDW